MADLQGTETEQKKGETGVPGQYLTGNPVELDFLIASMQPYVSRLGIKTIAPLKPGTEFFYDPGLEGILGYRAGSEKRQFFASDGILIELKENEIGACVTSYYVNNKGVLEALYTTAFEKGDGERQKEDYQKSIDMLMQLKAFVKGGMSQFNEGEGLRWDNGGFHVKGDGREIFFHDKYNRLDDAFLNAFTSPGQFVAGCNLFSEAYNAAINGSHSELAKHKLAIKIATNNKNFDSEYNKRFWYV